MKYKKLNLSLVVLCLIVCFACDQPSSKKKSLPESENNAEAEADAKKLEKQSEDFDKTIDGINNAMDLADELNAKIQQVERQFERGEINQQRKDDLISDLNEQYSMRINPEGANAAGELFPAWAKELGLSEPNGMVCDVNNSYQTNEFEPKEGYNSLLFVYKGSYSMALSEAKRIAAEANIPMSENYKKAQDLSEKLGKEIEGMKGMTYMNYKFGNKDDGQKYHISINVDENGKLTMTVVDVILKNARSEAGIPNLN